MYKIDNNPNYIYKNEGLQDPNHSDSFFIWALIFYPSTGDLQPSHWHDYSECRGEWVHAPEFKCVECKTELSPFWKLVFKLDVDTEGV